MNWKHYFGVGLAAFAAGASATAALQLHAGVPTTGAQWSTFGISAGVGGLIAIGALFTPKPGAS